MHHFIFYLLHPQIHSLISELWRTLIKKVGRETARLVCSSSSAVTHSRRTRLSTGEIQQANAQRPKNQLHKMLQRQNVSLLITTLQIPYHDCSYMDTSSRSIWKTGGFACVMPTKLKNTFAYLPTSPKEAMNQQNKDTTKCMGTRF